MKSEGRQRERIQRRGRGLGLREDEFPVYAFARATPAAPAVIFGTCTARGLALRGRGSNMSLVLDRSEIADRAKGSPTAAFALPGTPASARARVDAAGHAMTAVSKCAGEPRRKMPKTRGQLVLPCVAENGSYPGGRKRPSENTTNGRSLPLLALLDG